MTVQRVRTVFMGSPAFAVPSLDALASRGYDIVAVYTQPDRPAGRGRALASPAVKQAAARLGIAILQPETLRTVEEIERFRSLEPELVVVAAYGQILRRAVLGLPRYGCINVHASLLPRHRGASAVAAAILAGDVVSGVSIMQIDAGMDSGPVLARRATAIADADTRGSLTARLAELGAELLVETLPRWLRGEIVPEPQDPEGATLAPLLEKGSGTIDWSKAALRLWHEVRAFNPWPLSRTTLRGESVQIMEAWPLPDAAYAAQAGAVPGTILAPDDVATPLPEESRKRAGFAVVTGAGLFVPLLLRRAGRGAVSGADFARGVRDLPGAVLGR